ncbi:hypothetical protein ETN89_18020 [Photobacterium damselae subsp. damselae]|uniref:hypothetical protein n=1 Tax=Photobacterium damselae TaxID=38293 RepID=UPI000A2FC7CF|nr:hypothetical protein [Photobacterium damselae]ARR51070.1 hypothetical protein CAY62_16525 [Photobacterium damselae subsp. damselae]QAY37144.1 hypothetical protein ETN89_18020 [Photobacterium damselae subsp. damselae]
MLNKILGEISKNTFRKTVLSTYVILCKDYKDETYYKMQGRTLDNLAHELNIVRPYLRDVIDAMISAHMIEKVINYEGETAYKAFHIHPIILDTKNDLELRGRCNTLLHSVGI